MFINSCKINEVHFSFNILNVYLKNYIYTIFIRKYNTLPKFVLYWCTRCVCILKLKTSFDHCCSVDYQLHYTSANILAPRKSSGYRVIELQFLKSWTLCNLRRANTCVSFGLVKKFLNIQNDCFSYYMYHVILWSLSNARSSI